jgi:hypothetical protein
MKSVRSFSLLTFLLFSGVVALSVAIYSANNEVKETRALMKKYSDEMGYITTEDDAGSKLHVRRLGGYPQMSFGFRYQLPKKRTYTMRIGSGVIDPDTGFPPTLSRREISNDESQGTLIVSLQKMPTRLGTTWTVQAIDGNVLGTKTCDDANEFTWLQTYLAAFPIGDGVGNFIQPFPTASVMIGHQAVQTYEPDEVVVLFKKSEFHPSAVASLSPEQIKNRRTVMIWLEPIAPESKSQISSDMIVD